MKKIISAHKIITGLMLILLPTLFLVSMGLICGIWVQMTMYSPVYLTIYALLVLLSVGYWVYLLCATLKKHNRKKRETVQPRGQGSDLAAK